MAWTELRSSAVIGTARRAHLPDSVDGHEIPADLLPTTEARALAAAALLGTRRRAGVAARPGPTAPAPSDVDPSPPAPTAAVQLLDLCLAGNLGRPQDSNVLVAHWLRCAGDRGAVVPHRLLIGVLGRATSAPDLRDAARGAIGVRGRWLAAQRGDWSWAAGGAADAAELDVLVDRFATTSGVERRDVLTAIRTVDPSLGRDLLAATWPQERAADRAALLGCLLTGLGPDDDPFLDQALDDKAKSVREAAAPILDRLPTSARAGRLGAALRPLIDHSGLLRKRLTLAPLPDGTDLARDLPGAGPTETRRALVLAAPLANWTEANGLPPGALATVARDPEDLLAWWAAAATAQRDQDWGMALGLATGLPALLQLVTGPWSSELSSRFVAALRSRPTVRVTVMHSEAILIERLHPDAIPEIEAWRRSLGEDHGATDHALRHIIQLVTTRASITEAFS